MRRILHFVFAVSAVALFCQAKSCTTDPATAATGPDGGDTTISARGKALFLANCASCHHPARAATGPALYGALKRWGSKKRMYDFVHNSGKLIANHDPYATCIFGKWGMVMLAFPNLTDRELDELFAYTEQEGARILGADTSRPVHYSKARCQATKAAITALRQRSAELYGERGESGIVFEPGEDYENWTMPPDDQVSTYGIMSDFWKILFRTTDWRGVAELMKPSPGTGEVRLNVTAAASDSTRYHLPGLILIVPEAKIVARGGDADDYRSQVFARKDGRLNLPIGTKAYVLGIEEDFLNGTLYSGLAPFTVKQDNVVRVALQRGTPAAMESAVRALNLDGFQLMVVPYPLAPALAAVKDSLEREQQFVDQHCPCYMEVRN